jgi:hypothetical protein
MILSTMGTVVFADAADVAKIGDVSYATLADAVAAAQSGDTITLIADATGDVIIPDGVTLNGNNFAIIGVGDNFGSIRISDSLTDVAVTQPFQFGVGGQPVQIGFPVFQTVNTLFLYGNHGTVCSLTAE